MLPPIDRFGVMVPATSSTSSVREEARDFSTSSSFVAMDGLCARKVIFGGFLRIFRRLTKQIHSDPRTIKSTRAPPAIAIAAMVAGFKLVASGLSKVMAVELLPKDFEELAL